MPIKKMVHGSYRYDTETGPLLDSMDGKTVSDHEQA
jgi:hypothetical protein